MLAALLTHGLRPTADTSVALLRDQLNGLYRLEIRRLRDQVRGGAFPMAEYVPRVIELRGRYRLLSLPVNQWREPGEHEPLR